MLPRFKRERIVVAAVSNDVTGRRSSPVAPVAEAAEGVLVLRSVRPKFIGQNKQKVVETGGRFFGDSVN